MRVAMLQSVVYAKVSTTVQPHAQTDSISLKLLMKNLVMVMKIIK